MREYITLRIKTGDVRRLLDAYERAKGATNEPMITRLFEELDGLYRAKTSRPKDHPPEQPDAYPKSLT